MRLLTDRELIEHNLAYIMKWAGEQEDKLCTCGGYGGDATECGLYMDRNDFEGCSCICHDLTAIEGSARYALKCYRTLLAETV